MSFAIALLAVSVPVPEAEAAPPVAEVAAAEQQVQGPPSRLSAETRTIRISFNPARSSNWRITIVPRQPQAQNQVRVEQRVTIRISPRPAPAPQSRPQPNALADLPQREAPARVTERHMGDCVPAAGIAGVQAGTNNRLILYLRDRRVVSAALERSCSARDFYSGFYLERNADGQLCAKRDTLLSRNGANCRLTQFRQLVEADR